MFYVLHLRTKTDLFDLVNEGFGSSRGVLYIKQ